MKRQSRARRWVLWTSFRPPTVIMQGFQPATLGCWFSTCCLRCSHIGACDRVEYRRGGVWFVKFLWTCGEHLVSTLKFARNSALGRVQVLPSGQTLGGGHGGEASNARPSRKQPGPWQSTVTFFWRDYRWSTVVQHSKLLVQSVQNRCSMVQLIAVYIYSSYAQFIKWSLESTTVYYSALQPTTVDQLNTCIGIPHATGILKEFRRCWAILPEWKSLKTGGCADPRQSS